MPDKLYFLLGDLVANITVGACAALACCSIIGPSWNMLVAMLVAMALGMVIALILGVPLFMRYFGAMEVMVPTMLGGMLAGMFVGMAAAMMPVDAATAAKSGALIGLCSYAFCSYANYLIKGVTVPR
jgi:hypothetical protein